MRNAITLAGALRDDRTVTLVPKPGSWKGLERKGPQSWQLAATVDSVTCGVGRGQNDPALVREIAWAAVQGAEANKAGVEWLSPLVDGVLAERFDDIPRLAQKAATQAALEHLRMRPHDHAGADLVSEAAAHDAAVEHFSTFYMDVLDWSVGILQERQQTTPLRPRRCLRRARNHPTQPAQCEVPQRVLDGLTLRTEWPGRADHRAA